jgi:BolA protein
VIAVTAERVEAALRATLQPVALEVQDDSHLHAGHAGAKEGRHFTVRVTSEAFAGLTRVARHRLVYDALRSLVAEGIHALAIEARTPAEPRR